MSEELEPNKEYGVSTSPQLIGTRLGVYELQSRLGRGGMADVYCGFDTNLQRAVAIKVLSPAAAVQPGFAERFRQEAQLIANLRHPNIVQVYDYGEQDGHTYMVQELLAGPTLQAWMADLAARGMHPTPAEIRAIITQLAGALDAAHAAGIIHRDVKPANALWNGQEQLVLTDFGIAKQVAGDANLTQIGMVFGTPSYLSPEQAQSQPLTPTSDVYSLGVVLYELLAGTVPFRGVTPMRVVIDHIQTPPPPLPGRSDCPPEVEAVVLRALAKEPAARFASAGELARALAHAWGVGSAPERRVSNPDIHEQVTQHWQPPEAGAPAASGASRSSPRPNGNAVSVGTPDRRWPQQALPRARSSFVLPVLGTLLAIFLLGAVILAARGGARAADTTVRSATSVPTVIADATAPALHTSAPGQASNPSGNASGAATDLVGELRGMLQAARADGRVGQRGDELLAALDSAQQALAAGDKAGAVRHLTAIQQVLLAGAHEGTIDTGVMVEMIKRVQSLARSQGLTLPLVINFN